MTLYDVILIVASKVAGEFVTLALKRRSELKMQTTELLSEAEVIAIFGIARSTLFRLRRDDPTFPKPIKIGGKITRWTREKIEAWIAQKSQ
ncbi:MAG TPA: AlpA family phage regulatory protein [Planctomycetaceae bacterium]|nr:AlpA family phage regulatory protein [Planctomycetaceae bacterium]HQZ66736.1 AlpA family phage regulatory protein [Planctomycetaceae bacterium]